MEFILEQFILVLLGAIIVAFVALLIFLPFVRFNFNWESCKRLYPTFVLFLMFMLFLNIIHIGFLGFLPLDEEIIESLEIGSFFFIIAIAVYIGKNLSLQYILLQVNKKLEVRLEARTKELTESEEKYRQSIDMAGDAILAVAIDNGMILDANKKAEELFGYSRIELLNCKIWDIFSEKDRDKLEAEYAQTKIGMSTSGEFQVEKKIGGKIPVLCVWSLIRHGEKRFAQMIVTDITDRKKLEKELQEKSERLLLQTTKLESLYDSVKVLSSATTIDTFTEKLLEKARGMTNARYGAFATFSKDGRIKDFVTAGMSKAVIDKIGDRPKGLGLIGAGKDMKTPFRTDDLSKHPQSCGFPQNHPDMKSLLGVPLVAPEGETLGILLLTEKKEGSFTKEDEDIIATLSTEASVFLEKIRLLDHISKSKSEWQKTFDSISDFVVIHDNDHRIVRVNKPLQAKLGLPFNDINGKDCKILEGIFYEKKKGCPHEKVIELETHSVDEVVGSEGEAFFVSSYPLPDEENKISSTIHVARDISVYRMLAEAEIEMKRLDELNKFKSQFVSMVAHELRTPLTSLQGFIELLMTRDIDEETRKKWMNIINEESQMLGQLVSEILDLSQIEEGRLKLKEESVLLEDILRKEIERFNLRISTHTFREEIQNSPHKVRCDKEKIIQVLTNLLGNASKYSPDGKEIVVGVEMEGTMIKVSVNDSGYGIPEWEIEKIFDPFYRAHMPENADIKGTGLGLAISKAIIEMHGGELWAESEEGCGSTFYFTLPLGYNERIERSVKHTEKENSRVEISKSLP